MASWSIKIIFFNIRKILGCVRTLITLLMARFRAACTLNRRIHTQNINLQGPIVWPSCSHWKSPSSGHHSCFAPLWSRMHTSVQIPAVVTQIKIAFTLKRLRERAIKVRYTHTVILLFRNLFYVIKPNTSIHLPLIIKSPHILVRLP
jgi:hypothetical protein